jgi:hypothetical protein
MDVRGRPMFGGRLTVTAYKSMDVCRVPRLDCAPIQAVVAQTMDDGRMIARLQMINGVSAASRSIRLLCIYRNEACPIDTESQ